MNKYVVKESPVAGYGVFATEPIMEGEVIGFTGVVEDYFTPEFGMWLNHSLNDNCKLIRREKYLFQVAKRDIMPGEEILTNYHNTPDWIKNPKPEWDLNKKLAHRLIKSAKEILERKLK